MSNDEMWLSTSLNTATFTTFSPFLTPFGHAWNAKFIEKRAEGPFSSFNMLTLSSGLMEYFCMTKAKCEFYAKRRPVGLNQ